jgi:uncharacterized protein (TIGR02996 family)
MSEEEILLAAIDANRHDDAPRLAYADWLQEHGEEDKAEFVRLEYQLRRARVRLEELQPSLGAEWIGKVMGTASVVLVSYPPQQKINCIKIIRELTGVGLAEAKKMSESLPCVIKKLMPYEQAQSLMKPFTEVGAKVEFRFVAPN